MALPVVKSFVKSYMNMKEIVISWRAKETLNDLQVKQAKADKALETIKGLIDIPCANINTLALPSVKAFVAQKITEIDRAGFLTAETKQSLVQEWRAKEKVAIRATSQIQEFVEACLPQAVVSIQDGQLITDISLSEIADQKNLLDVPEKASEHFSLIMAIRTAIANLREFEETQDTKPMNLNTLLNIGEDEVAAAWATGHIHRDHRFDNLLNRASHKRNIIIGIN